MGFEGYIDQIYSHPISQTGVYEGTLKKGNKTLWYKKGVNECHRFNDSQEVAIRDTAHPKH